MPSEIDMYRRAKLLIDQHGADAMIFAAMRVDELADVVHTFYLSDVNEDE